MHFDRSHDAFDAVLLIAFGGPDSMDDVRPFLANVLRGRPVPPERVEEVVHHYELHRRPLAAQRAHLPAGRRRCATQLARDGPRLPVYVGMRNWHPYLRDTLAAMQRDGVRRALGFILAAQQSEASWERYQRDVAGARAERRRRRARSRLRARLARPPALHRRGRRRSAPQRAGGARRPSGARARAARLHGAQHPDGHGGGVAVRGPAARRARALVAEQLGIADYRSPTRAAAATRAIPGWSPTSATWCASDAARGARELLVVPHRLRLRSRRGAVRSRRRGASRSPTAAGIGFTARRSRQRPSRVHPHARGRRRAPRRAAMTERRPRRASRSSAAASAGLAAAHRLIELEPRARPARRRCACSRPARASAASIATERGGRLRHRGRARLVPLREARGAAALRAARASPIGWSARARSFAAPTSSATAACTRCRRLSAAGADALLAVGHDAALLLAGQAAHGARSGPAARRRGGDESLADFVTRRLGTRGARARRAAAGRRHLHGRSRPPQPRRDDAALPRDGARVAQRHPRDVAAAARARARRDADSGARWSLFLSFDGGMQCLVDALVAGCPTATVQLGRPVRQPRATAGRTVAAGRRIRVRRRDRRDPGARRGRALLRPLDRLARRPSSRAIEYASSATVTLAFRREEIPHPLDGFGFVVPHVERRRLLAGTFTSLKYPGRAPAGSVLRARFVGGALQPELLELDDDEPLAAVVRDELASPDRRPGDPASDPHPRWPRAMPQYAVGHLERVARIRRARRGARPSPRRQRLRGRRDSRLHPQRRDRRSSSPWRRSVVEAV